MATTKKPVPEFEITEVEVIKTLELTFPNTNGPSFLVYGDEDGFYLKDVDEDYELNFNYVTLPSIIQLLQKFGEVNKNMIKKITSKSD